MSTKYFKGRINNTFKFLVKRKIPKKLRRVAVWDEENKQTIEIMTNNFKWSGSTIAELYKIKMAD